MRFGRMRCMAIRLARKRATGPRRRPASTGSASLTMRVYVLSARSVGRACDGDGIPPVATRRDMPLVRRVACVAEPRAFLSARLSYGSSPQDGMLSAHSWSTPRDRGRSFFDRSRRRRSAKSTPGFRRRHQVAGRVAHLAMKHMALPSETRVATELRQSAINRE